MVKRYLSLMVYLKKLVHTIEHESRVIIKG